jgi:DNA-binding PadR family transcriptional regulator
MPGKTSNCECGCDMRGMLSFLILWILAQKPIYGQQIAKEIEKRKGSKPTPGTIYPALKELKKKGMITYEKKGRLTVYTITPKGRKALELSCGHICRMFGDIIKKHMA